MPGRKLQSTRVIVLGTGISLVAVFILLIFNFYLLRVTNQNLAGIDDVHTRKLDIVLSMNHIARERSMGMLTMYLEIDDWKIDQYFLGYHRLALDFIKLRDQLMSLGLSADEKASLEKILHIISETEPLQNTIVERIQSGERKGLRKFILQSDLPMEYKLLNLFDELGNIIRRNSLSGRIEAQAIYSRSLITGFILWLTISFVISLIMFRALRKVQGIEQDLIDETSDLSWKATHDPLTNIHNRNWLEHKIDLINMAETTERDIHSLIYIDLDNFKPINDYYGHAAGDQYLKLFSRQIIRHIRQHDTFARIGGDEFVILLDSCGMEKAYSIAESILDDISQFEIDYEGNKIAAHCSIGLLEFSGANIKMAELLKQADALCYKAKRQGKNQICQQTKRA